MTEPGAEFSPVPKPPYMGHPETDLPLTMRVQTTSAGSTPTPVE